MAATTTIEGIVAKIIGKGFIIAERYGWLDISKFAKAADVVMPAVGTKVALTLDGSNLVRKIETLGEPGAQPEPEHAAHIDNHHPANVDAKDLWVTRLACLNTATAIIAGTHGRANPDEVMEFAAKLEAWVLR